MLITRAVDVEVAIYKIGEEGGLDKPWLRRKLDIPFSFDSGRPRGFLPTLAPDFNGDGRRDFLSSGDGDEIEVFLGGPEYRFATRHARQKLTSDGRVRFGDLDGDGLDDFVLYAPRRPGSPLMILRNLGRLPGSPPRMTPAAE
jgi:hypothetical protein